MKRSVKRLLAAMIAATMACPAGLTDVISTGTTAFAAEEGIVVDGGSYSIEYDAYTAEAISVLSVGEYTDSIYDQLSDQQKNIYDTLYAAMKDGDAEKSTYKFEKMMTVTGIEFPNGSLTDSAITEIRNAISQEFSAAFFSLVYDHPELAWVDGRGYSYTFSFTYDPIQGTATPTVLTLTLNDSVLSGVTKSEMDSLINSAAAEIIKRRESSGKYHTVKAIHDYLCETVRYND